ncbi:MAG: sugar phosphate nucleotidyltransferase, partial [Pseudomonadota bacterium]
MERSSQIKIDGAMILAAGLGTRMRPLSDNCPKPLLKFGQKTIIDHIIETIYHHDINRIIINTHYLAHLFTKHFSKHKLKKHIH